MKKVRIKECCASCRHKTIENDGSRICSLMQIMVKQQFKCQKWAVAEGLAQTHWHMGKVKRREYLVFVFEIRMQEREAIDNGILLPEDVATLDSLRERFELETGLSPFMIH